MPSIEKLLKEEISRIARKEIKSATADIRKHSAVHRSSIADLKRRIAQLEKENHRLLKQAAQIKHDEPEVNNVDAIEKARITAKMIKSMRKRLGLSQAQLAALLGVTGQTVLLWEKKEGRIDFRGDAKAKIIELRGMKKADVIEKLQSMK